ncbi:DUF899 domain-containing protein [Kutzneria kofuensis]|uniref:Putative dithiol-disulfide oxidoreductase (DUF899 family) n=1 Tax=Kutzneria kofuensis TaxID=103725 RepID=A0A7W9NFE8_9PSEU|nr:DUF899 domain-containing protein [Kutzneria kofuensis]MBB5890046.1 putative dithiol-disulfide oxidoreductase (DUF899 family) [Kutzneria kofuensis]
MKVVEPEEWQAARKELLAREQELAAAHEAVRNARQQLPMVRVDKPYAYRGADGEVGLLDMFEGRRQLIVYHFMFDPSWDQGCKWCSYLVDNIGHLSHLHVRDTTLALVSRAPIEKILPFRERMGWTLPWYSSYGSDFNDDFRATLDKAEQGGASVFLRDGDTVFHTYSAFGESMDLVHTVDNYLDLTPLGRGDNMNWLRHHDRY